MTGFGAATHESDALSVTAELKSLNSKYIDIYLRLPRALGAERELQIRNLLTEKLQRGKINLHLELKDKNKSLQNQLQTEVIAAYYQKLQAVAQQVGAPTDQLLGIVMQLPDVVAPDARDEAAEAAQWEAVLATIHQAIAQCLAFRKDEGQKLAQSFENDVRHIQQNLEQIIAYDPKRVANIRERIQQRIHDLKNDEAFDPNRFEMEMVYYIEKLDISEEKVRLQSHIDHFLEALRHPEPSGKKLNFIAQEMGREINTIGSKANDAQLQRWVVGMKEALEKIKEQALNIL